MSGSPVTVAIDAMGGDGGVAVNVEGGVSAARELGVRVLLVGRKDDLERSLAAHAAPGLAVEIRHASEVVEMDESPSTALRRKKHSSIRVALDLVRRGEAGAFVSAGNTGAVMASALVVLGPLAGVERPAIAVVLPGLTGPLVLLDAGANVDCKPRHLLQFAIMGHTYCRDILGIPAPRVGLLSIGEEESKGSELTKEAFKAIEEEPGLRFIGNVEGRDVFAGTADVIVCDGFTGNVALKVAESLGESMVALLREEFTKDWRSKVGYLLMRPTLQRIKRRLDYSEYGGAPLLGVDGVTIIGHGRSSAKAIKNAIRVAGECVRNGLIRHIKEGVAAA
jgi:glycerol-3-phosphate acyltransferase PlsX